MAEAEIKEESMEGILKSIKNIISGGKPVDAAAAPSAPEEPLVLTEKVEDSGSEPQAVAEAMVDNLVPQAPQATVSEAVPGDVLSNIDNALSGAPAPAQPPPTPIAAAPTPAEPIGGEVIETPFPSEEPTQPVSSVKVGDEHLLNDSATKIAMNSLKNLVDSVPKPQVDSFPLRSGRTLDDLVVESLKPMMADWLNKNLPVIVQQIVEKEIKKILPRD